MLKRGNNCHASSKLNRVRFLTTATNSQIVIVYLGNNDVSEPRKEIKSRDSDYCFIIIISLLFTVQSRVLNICRLQWIVCAAVNAALFMCVAVYLNEFYGGYEVVWWILLNAIYLLGPNNSEHAEYRLKMWARGGKKCGGQSCSHSLGGLSVSNDNTSILHSSLSMTQKSSIPL